MTEPNTSPTDMKAALQYFADRPTPEFDEVVLRGDYAARAYLSLYRFRRTGGAHTRKPIRSDERLYMGVHYVTDHPPVRLFNLSLIALLILFESVANAYFFGLSSEFGLLGGLFQAAAVSLANVSVAYFIIGFWGLRHITAPWRHHWPKKTLGLAAIGIGLIVVLTINLSAAHYRNLIDLQSVPDFDPSFLGGASPLIPGIASWCDAVLGSPLSADLNAAAANAACRPFGLVSLDAVVLFALGMAIAALAAFEGRRSDAPFPGLSDAARQLEKSREDLREALMDYYDSYDDIIDDIKQYLKQDDGAAVKVHLNDRVELYRRLDDKVRKYRYLLETPLEELLAEFALQYMGPDFRVFGPDGPKAAAPGTSAPRSDAVSSGGAPAALEDRSS